MLDLTGDVLDLSQCYLGAVIESSEIFIDRTNAVLRKWVLGNHDWHLHGLNEADCGLVHPIFRKCCNQFTETVGDRKFLVMHGHEVDPYCSSSAPGVGEITAIVWGLKEDKNGNPFLKDGRAVEGLTAERFGDIANFWHKIWRSESRSEQLISAVEDYRMSKEFDVVRCGHTHNPGRIGNYHYNSGTWSTNRDTFLRIEEDGTVLVQEWDGHRAIACDVVLREAL
jgi:predicted phosphodiesterase